MVTFLLLWCWLGLTNADPVPTNVDPMPCLGCDLELPPPCVDNACSLPARVNG